MRPFFYNASDTDPFKVALSDNQMWEVEEVISHKGKLDHKTPKGKLSFVVRWRGYGNQHNTEEPWHNVFRTAALHKYLTKLGKSSLIPKQFRHDENTHS
jgi:hypothetical protein